MMDPVTILHCIQAMLNTMLFWESDFEYIRELLSFFNYMNHFRISSCGSDGNKTILYTFFGCVALIFVLAFTAPSIIDILDPWVYFFMRNTKSKIKAIKEGRMDNGLREHYEENFDGCQIPDSDLPLIMEVAKERLVIAEALQAAERARKVAEEEAYQRGLQEQERAEQAEEARRDALLKLPPNDWRRIQEELRRAMEFSKLTPNQIKEFSRAFSTPQHFSDTDFEPHSVPLNEVERTLTTFLPTAEELRGWGPGCNGRLPSFEEEVTPRGYTIGDILQWILIITFPFFSFYIF